MSQASFVDLRIKSRTLSDLLDDRNDQNHTFISREILQNTLEKLLHVDFSGYFQTKVFGPQTDEYDTSAPEQREPLEPLFMATSNKYNLPELLAGCGYDFARSRFGATHVDATLRWTLPVAATRPQQPSLVEVRTRKDFVDGLTDSQECIVKWDGNNRSPVTIKGERTPLWSRFSCLMPLHRRMNYELQFQLHDESNSARHKNVDNFRTNNEDWWLPNVSIRPSGTMESVNTALVTDPLGDRNFGLRFMVRRQLNWNVFGSSREFSEDELGTMLVLEARELGANRASALNVKLSTWLEQPLESLSLSIVQTIRPKLFFES